jgi:hypothetical protein
MHVRLPVVKTFLSSSTGWAIIVGLLGAAAVFIPWAEMLTVRGQLENGVIHSKDLPYHEWVYGTRFWHGYPTIFAFYGLVLFLVVTSPIKPVPLWRSIALLLAAAGILVLVAIGHEYNHSPALGDAPQQGIWVTYSWAIGSYIPFASALALAFLASLEIRARVAKSLQRSQEQTGA